jgi:glycopeptide antibiotics resistance protein
MVIDFDSSTVLLFAVLYLPVLVYLRLARRVAYVRLFLITVFYAYLVGVASKTLFPIFLDESMRQNLGQNVWTNMNFVPLVRLTLNDWKTSFLNIALFFPFGYLLPLLKSYSFRSVVWRGLLTSLGIEALQVIIALLVGFTFRHLDVNDVLFNVMGTILGYGGYVLFAWFVQKLIRKNVLERNAVIDYLDSRTKNRIA